MKTCAICGQVIVDFEKHIILQGELEDDDFDKVSETYDLVHRKCYNENAVFLAEDLCTGEHYDDILFEALIICPECIHTAIENYPSK